MVVPTTRYYSLGEVFSVRKRPCLVGNHLISDRADEGIRPYVIVATLVFSVGDDAHIVPQNDGR